MSETVRHILGLSGGKDSAALAVYMNKKIPQMEYFFCDTGKELQETYDYLDKLKVRLGIKINYLNPDKDFDYWLDVHGGYLPSPNSRWCTRQLKIVPLEKFVGEDQALSYIGIRADENRSGYISTKGNIKPVYPFREAGLRKNDIIRILEESGLNLPEYYKWRSRSGCYFCFFQRKYEWVRLSEEHPILFEKAKEYEKNHKDGRIYTWNKGERLEDIIKRKEKIIVNYEKRLLSKEKDKSNATLMTAMADILDEEGGEEACVMCHT